MGKGPGGSFRLLRTSPFDGTTEEVARFGHTGLFESHWLVSDHDGRVIVAASSSQLRRHVLVRVRLRDEVDEQLLHVEDAYAAKGELLAAPRVSAVDLALMVRASPDAAPTRPSFTRFPGEKGSPEHLGGCF